MVFVTILSRCVAVFKFACCQKPFHFPWKKKRSHFDLKSWVTAELKFDPRFRVIGEYLSQIDLILRVNSNWFSESKLTQYWDSIQIDSRNPNWLNIKSQFKLTFGIQIDSILRVNSNWFSESKLTQIFSNYSESRVKFQFSQWLNFLGQNDSIFSFSVLAKTSRPPVFSGKSAPNLPRDLFCRRNQWMPLLIFSRHSKVFWVQVTLFMLLC